MEDDPKQVCVADIDSKIVDCITVHMYHDREVDEVVGWCSDNGGDEGIRLHHASFNSPWVLGVADQIGEPYLLLQASIRLVYS
jgi:hypothetical protein